MLSEKKILVVGTGPSSFAFLKAIIDEQKCKIDLIDSSSYTIYENQECVFKNKFSGSRMPVDEKQLDSDKLISNHFGGFSTFWGGTFDNPSEDIFETTSTYKMFNPMGIAKKANNIIARYALLNIFFPDLGMRWGLQKSLKDQKFRKKIDFGAGSIFKEASPP